MTAASRPQGPGGPHSASASLDVPAIVTRLARTFPNATTELDFTNAFELLVATVLSAQSTDARVNTVTPALFARYPDAASLAKASPAELEPQIVPTGFFRQKSKALIGLAQALVAQHRGEVPADMEALTALPGVGRKTANVVLGHALGIPGLPVDRHVLRVANRMGIANAATPERVEEQLCARLPPEMWTLASDCLILHGRRVCRPRPLCQKCAINDVCLFYRRGGVVTAAPGAAHGRRAAKGARAGTERPATPSGAVTLPARKVAGRSRPVSETVAEGAPRRTSGRAASKKGTR